MPLFIVICCTALLCMNIITYVLRYSFIVCLCDGSEHTFKIVLFMTKIIDRINGHFERTVRGY